MNRILTFFLCLIISINLQSQNKPKLVIGIVIDQMSNEYIERFAPYFGDDGFKRVMNNGVYFTNTFYNYVPTATGPGHASIYTGTTPSGHGIAGNDWYDKKTKEKVYCVDDQNVNGVGTENEIGKRSPKNLVGSTVPDMLSLHTRGESKVISIALKDRSAILPGGYNSDISIWWDGKSGNWITSSHYTTELPSWVKDFNESNPAENYMVKWEPTDDRLDSEVYNNHNQYEAEYFGDAAWPHDLKASMSEHGFALLKVSPFGDDYTFDLAEHALESQAMGKDDITDFLCVSFSSTDYVGHAFGPYSAELEDAYVRFDQRLGEFLNKVDDEVGLENVILFLTADHGVVPNIEYLSESKFPYRRFTMDQVEKEINELINSKLGVTEGIEAIVENKIYLNSESLGKSYKEASRIVCDYLNEGEYVQLALSSHDLLYKDYHHFPANMMKRGFYPGKSGDVIVSLKPYTLSGRFSKGTTHGSPYTYDSHVPLMWMGQGIAKGKEVSREVEITQIAPTVCDLLRIQRPPFSYDPSLLSDLR